MIINLTVKISVRDLISRQFPGGVPDDLNLSMSDVLTLVGNFSRTVPGHPAADPWIELDLSGVRCDIAQLTAEDQFWKKEARDSGFIDTPKRARSPRPDRVVP